MVSSPVTDLLKETNDDFSHEESFEQENTLENEEGKTLEIHRFLDDGVKMVSVNGYTLPLDTLLEMVGFDLCEEEQEQEDEVWDHALFTVFVLSMAVSATCVLLLLIRV